MQGEIVDEMEEQYTLVTEALRLILEAESSLDDNGPRKDERVSKGCTPRQSLRRGRRSVDLLRMFSLRGG